MLESHPGIGVVPIVALIARCAVQDFRAKRWPERKPVALAVEKGLPDLIRAKREQGCPGAST